MGENELSRDEDQVLTDDLGSLGLPLVTDVKRMEEMEYPLEDRFEVQAGELEPWQRGTTAPLPCLWNLLGPLISYITWGPSYKCTH